MNRGAHVLGYRMLIWGKLPVGGRGEKGAMYDKGDKEDEEIAKAQQASAEKEDEMAEEDNEMPQAGQEQHESGELKLLSTIIPKACRSYD